MHAPVPSGPGIQALYMCSLMTTLPKAYMSFKPLSRYFTLNSWPLYTANHSMNVRIMNLPPFNLPTMWVNRARRHPKRARVEGGSCSVLYTICNCVVYGRRCLHVVLTIVVVITDIAKYISVYFGQNIGSGTLWSCSSPLLLDVINCKGRVDDHNLILVSACLSHVIVTSALQMQKSFQEMEERTAAEHVN